MSKRWHFELGAFDIAFDEHRTLVRDYAGEQVV